MPYTPATEAATDEPPEPSVRAWQRDFVRWGLTDLCRNCRTHRAVEEHGDLCERCHEKAVELRAERQRLGLRCKGCGLRVPVTWRGRCLACYVGRGSCKEVS
jgi:hypothetical protein